MNEQPFGFCIYGGEYFEGYKIIKEKHPAMMPFYSLKYFLLCRSIEITLKSFLLGKGLKQEELKKKLGHNINGLLLKSMSLNLEKICAINKKDKKIIEMLNDYYKDKEFEYSNESMHHIPDINLVETLTDKLYRSVYNFTEKLLKG